MFMELKRFYGSKIGDKLVLTDREYYHCVKVTRHKSGYSLIVCIGDGKDYYATIDKITNDEVICSVESIVDNNSETRAPLILCQAVCKELDFIVQKSVELGVTDIIPFYSERTNVKKVSQERLENIIVDAAKQCGRAKLPIVHEVTDFKGALSKTASCGNKVFCYENERNQTIESVIANRDEATVVIIGSEGGFSESEVEYAVAQGYKVVTLGRRILRAETAAIVALALTLDGINDIC